MNKKFSRQVFQIELIPIQNPKSQIQKLVGIVVLIVTLVMGGVVVEAQQAKKVPRIGVLHPGFSATYSSRSEAFLRGLHELGYVEGKTIVIEWRWGEERVENLPVLAAELVSLNLDVIVVNGTRAIKTVQDATSRIPIVMAVVGDPVATGIVTSLARPGQNVTGLSILAPELSGKRLELLKEIVPKLSQVSVILNPTNLIHRLELQETQDAAKALRLQIQPIMEVTDLNTLREGFVGLSRARARALLPLTDPIFGSMRDHIVSLAKTSRLPAMYFDGAFADAGGLMSYAPSFADLNRRAATYVDKILKGAKPGDLPVEQPTKFEFIINLKAAKQIGLTIPPNVLARADRVIR
jgi:putative tryptophan/tyrosine transport system substrate-binding protein